MKRVNIRESLLEIDRATDCRYDLTSLYEACNLDDEEKKKMVQYIEAHEEPEVVGSFLATKCEGLHEELADDDVVDIDKFLSELNDGESHSLYALEDKAEKELTEDTGWRTSPSNSKEVSRYVYRKILPFDEFTGDNSRYWDFDRGVVEGDDAKLVKKAPAGAKYSFSFINDEVDIDVFLGRGEDGDCWFVVDNKPTNNEGLIGDINLNIDGSNSSVGFLGGTASTTNEDIEDDELEYVSDFSDGEVETGLTFFADGYDWKWIRRIGDVVHLDFDNWAVWMAFRPEDENNPSGPNVVQFFIVDEDTGFIDWGPVDTMEEAKEFLQSKVDDYNNDESLEEDVTPYDKDMEFNDRYFPRVNIEDTARYDYVQHKGKDFAYDKKRNVLIYLFKDDEEIEKLGDKAPWRELDGVGLRAENWEDEEARLSYLDDYCSDLDTESSYLAQDFIQNELPYYQKQGLVDEAFEHVYDKDGNEIEPPLGRCECGRALIAGEGEEPHCSHCDRQTYDDDYYMLEDAEEKPYSKEQIEQDLKSLTNNFTVESDTLKCGFKEEAEYSEEILSQYYASVEVDKVGSWFQVEFKDRLKDANEGLDEGIQDFRFEVSCNDGPAKVISTVAENEESAINYVKNYYAQEHSTYADDRANKWSIKNLYDGKEYNESVNPADLTGCPECGDISFDSKRGRCTKCNYREELERSSYPQVPMLKLDNNNDFRFYVYSDEDTVVSDGFEYFEDAIDFAKENNYPLIKAHIYYRDDEDSKLMPDGEPKVVWDNGEVLLQLDYSILDESKPINETIATHIYLFPELTDEDMEMAKAYGLQYLGKNHGADGSEDNWVVAGSENSLTKFAERWLGYELHPDYLYDADDFAGDIVED